MKKSVFLRMLFLPFLVISMSCENIDDDSMDNFEDESLEVKSSTIGKIFTDNHSPMMLSVKAKKYEGSCSDTHKVCCDYEVALKLDSNRPSESDISNGLPYFNLQKNTDLLDFRDYKNNGWTTWKTEDAPNVLRKQQCAAYWKGTYSLRGEGKVYSISQWVSFY